MIEYIVRKVAASENFLKKHLEMKYAEAQRCGTNSSFKWSYSHDNICQSTRNISRNVHFFNSFAKLNLYKIFFPVIYRLLRFGEKKECRRQRFSDFQGCPLQNFLQKWTSECSDKVSWFYHKFEVSCTK